MSQLNLPPKNGSKVLWLDTLHGRNNVEDGTVIGVWGTPDAPIFGIVWIEGYQSRTDDIGIDRILAVYDPSAPKISLSNFSGRGYLTEAGKKWLENIDEKA